MDADEREAIGSALSLLHSIASQDCYCEERGCSPETPHCDVMHARAAKIKLEAALDPKVRSLHANRLTNPSERICFEVWQKENQKIAGLNDGYGVLEWVLCPPGQRWPSPVSQRDMDVATAIVQWLGTNCGHAMLWEIERRIKEENAERSILNHSHVNFGDKKRDLFERMLDAVLKDTLPNPKHVDEHTLNAYSLKFLREKIGDNMRFMFCLYAVETGMVSLNDAAQSAGVTKERFKELQEHAKAAVEQRVERMNRKKAEPKPA